MKRQQKHWRLMLLTAGMSVILLTACSDDNSVQPTPESPISSNSDAAESIAAAIGEQSGGVVDQVGDVIDLTQSIRLGKAVGDGFIDHREATYDESTGTWTLILQRERGVPGQIPYGSWDRVFTYQFLNAAGEPQKRFITNSDTARTIHFNIVEGDGYLQNFRLTHDLTEIQGAFVATNVQTENVTVNGTYRRAAIDTIITERFTRTSDHVLDLTVTDLVGPKGSRRDLAQKLSGTITGTFHADITFDGERGYAEKTVDKEIFIEIGGGEAEIDVEGEPYVSSVETGQVK